MTTKDVPGLKITMFFFLVTGDVYFVCNDTIYGLYLSEFVFVFCYFINTSVLNKSYITFCMCTVLSQN